MPFIVTGASSGIGFAVAQSLALRNHDVIAVARRVIQLKSLKKSYLDRIQVVPADLSTEAGRKAVVKEANSFGKIDGIIHAAGSLITPATYQHLNADQILADLNIHVTVPLTLNNTLEDKLAGGRILYIDSYSANNLRVGWSGYSIVKAAAQMAARSAAQEITRSTVIRVFPGAVQTPLVQAVLSAQQESPTRHMFKEMELNSTISKASVVGEFIADILVTATNQQLEDREVWDINNPADQIF